MIYSGRRRTEHSKEIEGLLEALHPYRGEIGLKLTERLLASIFARADVAIDGQRAWDIRVLDPRFYRTVLLRGSLGLGESYMRQWWTCADLEELFFRLIRGGLENVSRLLPMIALGRALASALNQQTTEKSRRVAERHYNMGNDLFLSFLGGYKNYSSGDFDNVVSLEQAQLQKMERICRGLALTKEDRLLDVGGGWGEFARYAADRYGCQVTSINISDEQIRHATQYCKNSSVEIRKCDYRDVAGRYTKIAVIAMLTHVGRKNYRQFMESMDRCLEPGGLMLIESVGAPLARSNCEPWVNKYIFPGGVIPSLADLDRAVDGMLRRESTIEWGSSYVKTLRAWWRNLDNSWPELRSHYSKETRLMFEYFFLSCAGAFRAEDLLYWHVLMKKNS